ncbi:MAG: hypothetical protein HFI93_05025 [Lachnospiraceae bacterium]|nr:hypothetical protein [Lachnospiraceae bacterium]
MGIELFQHNEEAYRSALFMLKETGKAAVVHPTGTGKSFIGFKLCEDFPEKTILWLSPSEYIFRTQLENLRRAADGYQPGNVAFRTYARLVWMDEEEIASIRPDVIVLDEFHRCGARQWGAGVQRLLAFYPKAGLLGLSATAVRYLDNRRDMADELFEGNVASEMTLGEAIVRGILCPPKYVLSVFSYRRDLEKYERRVRLVKNRAVREKGEKYLEALRRALEKADGCDEIFSRHMADRTGKYLVFCANKEHMDEMMRLSSEWFQKVDREAHVYSVYTGDPMASESFRRFREDESNRLRLLYCIDALNEGIHVEDISGVILLRPTVSPIVYKQQIGRAFSAGKKKGAVIFDIVLNIENLFSIGAVEEEMQIAAACYRSRGRENEIVREHFRVVDEVRDCIALFEKLNKTLGASWDLMYDQAKRYYEACGNLDISSRYRTEDGYSLGNWVFVQRNVRRGVVAGRLSEEQIRKLDEIGMVWESVRDVNWSRNYAAAREYYGTHGDLDVPAHFVTKAGVFLGLWLGQLRNWERSGARPGYLTPARKERLDEIGMIWNKPDHVWEQNYAAACDYLRENGHLRIPASYATGDGIRLGAWLARQRALRAGKIRRGRLTEEQIARLDAIGMIWDSRVDSKWEKGYEALKVYMEKYGNAPIPADYRSADGLILKSWVQNQRKRYRSGKLEEERKKQLDAVGFVWGSKKTFDIRIFL